MLGLLWEGVPWRVYFSNYRPTFHPWDHDNRPQIAEWKERYKGFGERSGPGSDIAAAHIDHGLRNDSNS